MASASVPDQSLSVLQDILIARHPEEKFMQAMIQTVPVSQKTRWVGRIMSGLPALFLLVDGVMKLAKPALVVEGTLRYGFSESVIIPLGILLTACTTIYVIPRTAVLGAISADRLSGRRHRHARALRRSLVPDLVSSLYRRTGLGWTLLARWPAARAHTFAKLA
jgi:hypothetical protein